MAYRVVAWTRKRRVPIVTTIAVTNELGVVAYKVVAWTQRGVPTVTNIAVTNEDVGSSKDERIRGGIQRSSDGYSKRISTSSCLISPEDLIGWRAKSDYEVILALIEEVRDTYSSLVAGQKLPRSHNRQRYNFVDQTPWVLPSVKVEWSALGVTMNNFLLKMQPSGKD
nr:hypothetical protein [Tanacetum cinerariifolium]